MTFSSTAPAHPHATRVAVYPALLIYLVTTRPMYRETIFLNTFFTVLLQTDRPTDRKVAYRIA